VDIAGGVCVVFGFGYGAGMDDIQAGGAVVSVTFSVVCGDKGAYGGGECRDGQDGEAHGCVGGHIGGEVTVNDKRTEALKTIYDVLDERKDKIDCLVVAFPTDDDNTYCGMAGSPYDVLQTIATLVHSSYNAYVGEQKAEFKRIIESTVA